MTSSYLLLSLTIWGLGPINDISPIQTFKNWGSSSIKYFRMSLPNFVILSSSAVAGNESASSFSIIDRNLIQVKILPSLLFLFCKKKTGPLESSLIKTAMIGISQLSTPRIIIVDKKISPARLMALFGKFSSGRRSGSVVLPRTLANFLSSIDKGCIGKGACSCCLPLITNISGIFGKVLVISTEDFSFSMKDNSFG